MSSKHRVTLSKTLSSSFFEFSLFPFYSPSLFVPSFSYFFFLLRRTSSMFIFILFFSFVVILLCLRSYYSSSSIINRNTTLEWHLHLHYRNKDRKWCVIVMFFLIIKSDTIIKIRKQILDGVSLCHFFFIRKVIFH